MIKIPASNSGMLRACSQSQPNWNNPNRVRRVFVTRFRAIFPVAVLLLLAAARMHAQDDIGGCTDSPENPTLVLGLIVGAASVGYVQIRQRLRGRRNTEK